jgi:hypothetical protein
MIIPATNPITSTISNEISRLGLHTDERHDNLLMDRSPLREIVFGSLYGREYGESLSRVLQLSDATKIAMIIEKQV